MSQSIERNPHRDGRAVTIKSPRRWRIGSLDGAKLPAEVWYTRNNDQ